MPNQIEPGATIFIDSNILMYAISGHWKYGKDSKELLDAVNDGIYKGIISVLVCNEIFHRAIVAEAVEKQNVNPGSAVRCLNENPELVKGLNKAWSVVEGIKKIKHLRITGIDEDTFELALSYSKMYGLLSNDALHLATMKRESVSALASNDRDFERVEWIKLWRPM